MEQNQNPLRPEAATDEPASPVNLTSAEAGGSRDDPPSFEPPPLLSDCLAEVHADTLEDSLEGTLAATFPPGSRKPRHDGWTPEIIEDFLRHLAASGVVDHAARAVGRSVASAYAFRNRRQGRAFASMWDAVLIHRARARIASELQGRAIAGCVSVRRKDGEIVSEYHYYDNRLAMSLLTRLDRLAEREAASEAHLRTLSEDLDDFCEHIAEGGDGDAFVEARRPVLSEAEGPVEPEPKPEPVPPPPDDDPELTRFAIMTGCHHYRDVHPFDIEVRDLDPTRQHEWEPDQWMRFFRSGFSVWLEGCKKDEPELASGPGAPLRYHFARAVMAAALVRGDPEPADPAEIDISDLDPAAIEDWTDDQLVRAWNSGLLQRLPGEFWDDLAAREEVDGDEE